MHLDKADKPISVIVNLMEVSDKRVRDVDDVVIGFIIFKVTKTIGNMVQWVVGSILYGGPIDLFLVSANAP